MRSNINNDAGLEKDRMDGWMDGWSLPLLLWEGIADFTKQLVINVQQKMFLFCLPFLANK